MPKDAKAQLILDQNGPWQLPVEQRVTLRSMGKVQGAPRVDIDSTLLVSTLGTTLLSRGILALPSPRLNNAKQPHLGRQEDKKMLQN